MNKNITVEDIGTRREIELAAEIIPNHSKRLIAVILLDRNKFDRNKVFYNVLQDGEIAYSVNHLEDALEYYNGIYLPRGSYPI